MFAKTLATLMDRLGRRELECEMPTTACLFLTGVKEERVCHSYASSQRQEKGALKRTRRVQLENPYRKAHSALIAIVVQIQIPKN